MPAFMPRTYVRDLSKLTGQKVLLKGWVAARRDHGKLVFIDLKDYTGVAQVVFSPKNAAAYEPAQKLRDWWVIVVEGEVKARPEGMVNPNLASGTVEVAGETLAILNESLPLPFPVDTPGYDISEELRLKYRYLDLRRERLLNNLRFRQKYMQFAREYLIGRDFLEVETPILSKSTPEGSRDFLVPSRLQPGQFYALPQSPQQYKQMLMISGFERYFQFARVFRDEDLRADRLFEHTQLDLEMAFADREGIFGLIEPMLTEFVESSGYHIQEKPFPRLPYDEALARYQTDKPDLRGNENEPKLMTFAWIIDFPMFEKKDDGAIGAAHHPFTAVKDEHVEWLTDKEKIWAIRSKQYDLVLNGHEVFGGSIRTHQPEILVKVFEAMGYKKKAIEAQFGHLLEAFRYGVPPHGGIAGGVERLLMTLLNEPSLREVTALPMTSSGKTAIMDSPSPVPKDQLSELHLRVAKTKKS